jgi:hypothetical protein
MIKSSKFGVLNPSFTFLWLGFKLAHPLMKLAQELNYATHFLLKLKPWK